MTPEKNLDDILASIRKIVIEDGTPVSAESAGDVDEALLDPDFDTRLLGEVGVSGPSMVDLPDAATINDTARALLQPMLKSWLDANLPEIVEASVAAEIRRLTGHS